MLRRLKPLKVPRHQGFFSPPASSLKTSANSSRHENTENNSSSFHPQTTTTMPATSGRSSAFRYEANNILKKRDGLLSDFIPSEYESMRQRAVKQRYVGTVVGNSVDNVEPRSTSAPEFQQRDTPFNNDDTDFTHTTYFDLDRRNNKKQSNLRRQLQRSANSMPRHYDVNNHDMENDSMSDEENTANSRQSSNDDGEHHFEDQLHSRKSRTHLYNNALPPRYFHQVQKSPEVDGVPGEWVKRSRTHIPGKEVFKTLVTKEDVGDDLMSMSPHREQAREMTKIEMLKKISSGDSTNTNTDAAAAGGVSDYVDDISTSPTSTYATALELPKLKSYSPSSRSNSSDARNSRDDDDDDNEQAILEAMEGGSLSFEERQDKMMQMKMRENKNHHHQQQSEYRRDSAGESSPLAPPDRTIQLLHNFTQKTTAPSQESIAFLSKTIAEELSSSSSSSASSMSPILRKIRRSARIATDYSAWMGALGLLTALRVAPYVEVNNESSKSTSTSTSTRPTNTNYLTALKDCDTFVIEETTDDEGDSSRKGKVCIRKDYISTNYAVALAIAQASIKTTTAASTPKRKQRYSKEDGNDNDNDVNNHDDNNYRMVTAKDQVSSDSFTPIHLTPALAISKAAVMSNLSAAYNDDSCNQNDHRYESSSTNPASSSSSSSSSSSMIEQQLYATSTLCTNYIISAACRLTTTVSPSEDPQHWMVALSLLNYLSSTPMIISSSNTTTTISLPDVDEAPSSSSSSSPLHPSQQQPCVVPPPPQAILGAVPSAFTYAARSLQRCGELPRAIELLQNNEKICFPQKQEDVLSMTTGYYSHYYQTLARLLVLSPTIADEVHSSSLSVILNKLLVAASMSCNHHHDDNHNSNTQRGNNSSSRRRTIGSGSGHTRETVLSCLKSLIWRAKMNPKEKNHQNVSIKVINNLLSSSCGSIDEKQHQQHATNATAVSVDESKLLKLIFDNLIIGHQNPDSDDEGSNIYNEETISSLGSILSISDAAVKELSLCEDLISFVNERGFHTIVDNNNNNYNNDDDATNNINVVNTSSDDRQEDAAVVSSPYNLLLAKTNLLAHPLVLSGLMKSCVRNSLYQQAAQLFEQVLPHINSLSRYIPSSAQDRRISYDNIDRLVGAMLAVRRGNSTKQQKEGKNNHEDEDEQEFDLLRSIESMRSQMTKKVRRMLHQSNKLEKMIAYERNNIIRKASSSSSSSSKLERLEKQLYQLSQSLALYAPSSHERGVYECVLTYLVAVDGQMSSSSKSSSSSSSSDDRKNRNNSKGEVINEIMSTMLPQSSWRFEFMPQLLQLLYNHGFHSKISSIYFSVKQSSEKLLIIDNMTMSTSYDDDDQDDDKFNLIARKEKMNNNNNNKENLLDPASVDFESLQLVQMQDRKEQRKSLHTVKQKERVERLKHRGRRRSRNDTSHSRDQHHDNNLVFVLPLVLDTDSLCFCAQSMCEIGHHRLAAKIVEDDLLGGQDVVRRRSDKVLKRKQKESLLMSNHDSENDGKTAATTIRDAVFITSPRQERKMALSGHFNDRQVDVDDVDEEEKETNERVEVTMSKVKTGLGLMRQKM